MSKMKIKVHETRYTRAFIPGEPIVVYAPNGRKLITGYGLGGEFSGNGDSGCIVFSRITDLELIDIVYTLKGVESGFTDTVRFVDSQVWSPEEVVAEYKNLHYKVPRDFVVATADSNSGECDVVWFTHADTATAPGTKVVRIGGKAYDTCNMDGKTWLAEDLSINDGGDGIIEYKGTTYYTWDAAQRVCPDGWRIPTRSEIEALYKYAGGSSKAGRELRSRNYKGSDTYGFNLVPKGIFIGDDNSPRNYGTYSYLWTSSMSGAEGCGWGTNTMTDSAYFNRDPRSYYCVVRLIQE